MLFNIYFCVLPICCNFLLLLHCSWKHSVIIYLFEKVLISTRLCINLFLSTWIRSSQCFPGCGLSEKKVRHSFVGVCPLPTPPPDNFELYFDGEFQHSEDDVTSDRKFYFSLSTLCAVYGLYLWPRSALPVSC